MELSTHCELQVVHAELQRELSRLAGRVVIPFAACRSEIVVNRQVDRTCQAFAEPR